MHIQFRLKVGITIIKIIDFGCYSYILYIKIFLERIIWNKINCMSPVIDTTLTVCTY